MRVDDAIDFIAPALPPAGGNRAMVWADVGAGDGTFTRALARRLGEGSRVYAIDRDRVAIQRLSGAARTPGDAEVLARMGDIADRASWTALGLPALDGILLANTLHFIPYPEQCAVLDRLASSLMHDGRLLLIEYEHRAASRWVPYPVDFEQLRATVPATLSPATRIASRPSAFGGSMSLSLMRKT
jgi:phospholipid N-methyltransferase